MKRAYRSTALSVLAAVTFNACSSEIAHVAPRSTRVQTFDYARLAGKHPSSWAIARALDLRLRVNPTSVEPTHIKHCRLSAMGCRARLAALSNVLTESSLEHGVDPFLAAAIAVKETKLNPDAVGPVGERGIMQLHPRFIGKTVRYVRDPRYRASCAYLPSACQKEIVDAGLELFQWAQQKC